PVGAVRRDPALAPTLGRRDPAGRRRPRRTRRVRAGEGGPGGAAAGHGRRRPGGRGRARPPAPSGRRSGMRLRRLVLRNFRGVEDRAVEFGESGVTVVVGDNETGKSSLLEAFELLRTLPDDSR